MKYLKIYKSKFSGTIDIPPSKSQTMRALVFALMANGKSVIHNYLPSKDTLCMVEAIKSLGAKVQIFPKKIEVIGVCGKLKPNNFKIFCNNSGLILRLMTAITALQDKEFYIYGDSSINKRPIKDLLFALHQLKAKVTSFYSNGFAPITVKGPIQAGFANLIGDDSQPLSALLIASSFLNQKTVINVENLKEKPWIDVTLSWLNFLNIKYTHLDYKRFEIYGFRKYFGFEYFVPGDFSTAAYPIVASLITNSEIFLKNIDFNDSQGDKALIFKIIEMGANIEIDKKNKTLLVKKDSKLKSLKTIDMDKFIDAITILPVLCSQLENPTILFNAKGARDKECDRISIISKELKKMSLKIEEKTDGLQIENSKILGSEFLNSYNDHRIALSLATAAFASDNSSIIKNFESNEKTFPDFVEKFQKLGAKIEMFS